MKPGDIHETVASWTEDPDKAAARLDVSVRSAGPQGVVDSGLFSWWSDLPPPLGGSGQAPSPTTLLLSALASCAVVFVRDTLAPQSGVRVDHIEATARCDTDYRGLLGLGGVGPGLERVQLTIRVTSPEGESSVRQLYDLWEERSPVLLALTERTRHRHEADGRAVRELRSRDRSERQGGSSVR